MHVHLLLGTHRCGILRGMSNGRLWRAHIDRKRYGQIASISNYRGEERRILQYCRRVVLWTKDELERRYGWDLSRVDFFFLDKREPNAVMLRQGRRHAIGICVGLPFRHMKDLRRALKDPDFLAEYLMPQEHEEWSMRFLGMLIEHAYLHELAHAVRGHLLYKRATANGIDERSGSLGRYLEIDADIHALDMWLAITEVADDFPKSEQGQLELYFQKVFTLQIFYQVFDAANLPLQAHRREHPAPIHRALVATAAMAQSIPQRLGLTTKTIKNAHHQAMWEASIAARTANLIEDRWWGGVRGRRRGIRECRRMIRYYLEVVEPRLDAFVASLPDDIV